MLPSTKVTLAGCTAVVALAVAWPGPIGMGSVTGFLAGAGVALASAVLQKRIVAQRPSLLVHVFGGAFLVKIFALLALTLCVRYVAPLAASLDWRAFMLAFAAAVLGLLPCTAWEVLRIAHPKSGSSSARERAAAVALQQGTPS